MSLTAQPTTLAHTVQILNSNKSASMRRADARAALLCGRLRLRGYTGTAIARAKSHLRRFGLPQERADDIVQDSLCAIVAQGLDPLDCSPGRVARGLEHLQRSLLARVRGECQKLARQAGRIGELCGLDPEQENGVRAAAAMREFKAEEGHAAARWQVDQLRGWANRQRPVVRQVIACAARGLNRQQTADRLAVSRQTVQNTLVRVRAAVLASGARA